MSKMYGNCPRCGSPGIMRERRPNGNDKCSKSHVYPSSQAVIEEAVPLQQLESYYVKFNHTYCEPVDDLLGVLTEVCKNHHHLAQWGEPVWYNNDGKTPVDNIQDVANKCVAYIGDLKLQNAKLQMQLNDLEMELATIEHLGDSESREALSIWIEAQLAKPVVLPKGWALDRSENSWYCLIRGPRNECIEHNVGDGDGDIWSFFEDLICQLPLDKTESLEESKATKKEINVGVEYCHAGRDGDCIHRNCPQLRDNEPYKTGRSCPLPEHKDENGN